MINNEVTQPIIHSIAKILQELHFDFDEFVKAMREDYIKTVYDECHSLYQAAVICGIDRRAADAILKGQFTHHKRAILLMVIEEIKKYLKHKNDERISFNLDKDLTMAKYGNNSIDSIVKDNANGATSTISVLKSLVKIGVIKDIGPRFQFLGYPPPQASARDKLTIKFSQKLDELVNDYVQQMQSVSKLYHQDNDKEENV